MYKKCEIKGFKGKIESKIERNHFIDWHDFN